jgi:hypothetical protein
MHPNFPSTSGAVQSQQKVSTSNRVILTVDVLQSQGSLDSEKTPKEEEQEIMNTDLAAVLPPRDSKKGKARSSHIRES